MTNLDLVAHAQKALSEGWGYVWGTFGQVLTPDLFAAKVRQYPDGVGNYFDFIRTHWVGRRTTDCVGLIKGCYWGEGKYFAATDVSADGMFAKATEKGDINGIPEIPGLCVRKEGHIGVYIGDGWVIEAHGTKYGVIKTPLKGGTPWTHWLKCPYLNYVTAAPAAPAPAPAPAPSVSYNAAAADLQRALNAGGFRDNAGHQLDTDGKPGPLTKQALAKVALGPGSKNAVVGWVQSRLHISVDNAYGQPPRYHETYDAVGKWQANHGLKVDHVIGINTLLSLI
jgi:hypothetical protein